MTSAPPDLLVAQAYARTKTGQPWDALGIIHATPQGGGYHEGQDLLVAARRAPGPQYPYGDYSYDEAPDRDLAAPYDMNLRTAIVAGGNYASAFDLGGNFPRYREFNAWVVGRCEAHDPRTRDIREVIYSLDGKTVKRWDARGKRDTGDSTHTSHTHFSFYRDSLGRRDDDDNFLGLLKQWFGDLPDPNAVQPPHSTQEEDDMGASLPPRCIPLSPAYDSACIPPVSAGAADPRPAWLNICNDTNGVLYALRIWGSSGNKDWYSIGNAPNGMYTLGNGERLSLSLPKGTCALHISRQPVNADFPTEVYAGPLTYCIERGAVGA